MSVPPLGTAAPPRWFAAYDPTGALGAFNGQLGCQPAAVIADLARSGGKVTVVGRSKVRGVPATQFQVTFRPGDRLNVWVDAKGLLRRYQLSIDIGNVEQVVTDDFYDFGVPVTVSAPPASQVQFIPDADPNKKVAVYVAATDIPAGSPGDSLIAASDFQQSTVPVRSYPRDALTNLGEIRGKVTTIPITKGQVIIATQFDAPSHTPTTTTQTAPPTGNGC